MRWVLVGFVLGFGIVAANRHALLFGLKERDE